MLSIRPGSPSKGKAPTIYPSIPPPSTAQRTLGSYKDDSADDQDLAKTFKSQLQML